MKKDVIQAKKWIEKSAAKGCDLAQYVLGVAYVAGDDVWGIEKDLIKGIDLLTRAAYQGNEDARKLLNEVTRENSDAILQEAYKRLRKD